ncbi:VOC family protein [Kroppenstedtia pulmonis]|uniref:VOC family protein n=1 Tax=Kroppenstedtia pulmonis TaxID=1380685 RepID=A0A7D3XT15_9BACL|nr:VOC family protein [Kroppenstedtia pulmonis]QKG85508.1 VOC family protein [Kroppenstedtia pulmonis]
MNQSIHNVIQSVHLIISDLNRSIHYYQEILGFQLLNREKNTALLTADGITPLLRLEEGTSPRPKPPGTTGLYHFAILVPKRPDLARCLRYLMDIGLPLGASDHHFSEALYLQDPDGNGIEIYTDRPRSQWQNEKGEWPAVSVPLDMKGLLAEAGKTAWNGFPPGTRIGHIHLHVADLQQAETFYCDGLGFEPTLRWRGALFVSVEGYHHHIGLNTWMGVGAPPPPRNSVGLHDFSVTLPTRQSVDQVVEGLSQMGAPVDLQHDRVFTKDPFGNQIQIRIR